MGDFKFQAFWLFGFFYMQWRASEELCFKKETGSGMNANEDEEGITQEARETFLRQSEQNLVNYCTGESEELEGNMDNVHRNSHQAPGRMDQPRREQNNLACLGAWEIRSEANG